MILHHVGPISKEGFGGYCSAYLALDRILVDVGEVILRQFQSDSKEHKKRVEDFTM